MRIVTWNINSVRLRIGLIERLVTEVAPDVLCLQETKVTDALFPRQAFVDMGLPHAALAGMPNYNGVAILSRFPLDDVEIHNWCGREDSRHVTARLPNGIEVHNLYVPSGGDVPDPEKNPKFAHKLDFVDAQTAWWPAARHPSAPMVLVGDLNIAPLETDVWSHKQMLDVVSHTPVEVAKLTALQRSIGWVDAVRHFVPESEKLYSWWSYRARDWHVSDRGRRLDHIWVTAPLLPTLEAARILRPARGWPPKPSDHVPVIVDLSG